jgi:hypothetical protein
VAEQGAVSAQYIVSKTVENRLEAERDGEDTVTYDPDLLARFAGDHRLLAAMDLQEHLLDTRRAGLAGEIDILEENLTASAVQLKGLQQVYGARASQIGFLDQELHGTRTLAAEGYVPAQPPAGTGTQPCRPVRRPGREPQQHRPGAQPDQRNPPAHPAAPARLPQRGVQSQLTDTAKEAPPWPGPPARAGL